MGSQKELGELKGPSTHSTGKEAAKCTRSPGLSVSCREVDVHQEELGRTTERASVGGHFPCTASPPYRGGKRQGTWLTITMEVPGVRNGLVRKTSFIGYLRSTKLGVDDELEKVIDGERASEPFLRA